MSVMVTGCVLFDVRTDFLNIIYTGYGFKLLLRLQWVGYVV